MYRSDLKTTDRSGAIAAVAAIHGALLFAFLHLSGTMNLADPQSVLRVFDVTEVPPPPPPMPDVPKPAEQNQKPKEKEGAASPKNLKSKATPVVAPKPPVALPIPLPVNTTQTPNQGAAPTQGASSVAGPGTGAGGTGTGTGSGGAGSGTGGGGQGLAAVRTRLATRPLRGRDFPPQLLDEWPRGAWIRMRFRVDSNGSIIQCIVDQGTGVPAIDSEVCAVARQRLRYQPALDRSGQRVADWAGYGQEPPR
ncbi:MAG: energy transducer TonB [Sphingomonas sp.]|nr:energy transducer TonB [Sphingomonas sp.]